MSESTDAEPSLQAEMLHLRLYYMTIIASFPVGLAWWALVTAVYLESATGSGLLSVPDPYSVILLVGTAVSVTLILVSWKVKEVVRVKISDGTMLLEDIGTGKDWAVVKVQSEYPTVVFVTASDSKSRVEKRELQFRPEDIDRAKRLLRSVFPGPTIEEASPGPPTRYPPGFYKETDQVSKLVVVPTAVVTLGLILVRILFRLRLLLYLAIIIFVLGDLMWIVYLIRIQRRYSGEMVSKSPN